MARWQGNPFISHPSTRFINNVYLRFIILKGFTKGSKFVPTENKPNNQKLKIDPKNGKGHQIGVTKSNFHQNSNKLLEAKMNHLMEDKPHLNQ